MISCRLQVFIIQEWVIMNWIRQNKEKTLIIAILLILLFMISASASRINADDDASAIEHVIQQAVAEAGTPVSAAADKSASFFSGIIHFRQYQKENQALKEENEALKEQLREAELSEAQLSELKSLKKSLSYSDDSAGYTPVAADIISLNQSGMFGVMTISAGKKDGVKKGCFVVNGDGLVGLVTSVTNTTAKVRGVIDKASSVSFYVKDETDLVGIVSGDGKGGLTGYLFDNDRELAEESVLMTSGLGRYPEGIEIGTVTDVVKDKSTGQVSFQADPAVNFYAADISAVFVEE